MMAVLRSVWNRLNVFNFGSNEPENDGTKDIREKDVFSNVLGPLESYVVTVQSILIWEKPWRSSLTFLLANVLFWVIISCKCRLYFVLTGITAIIYVCRTWVNQIWPEIRVPIPEDEDTEEWTPVNPQVLSVPEISRYLNQVTETIREWGAWLIELRKTEPGRFCALVTSILVTVTVISHYISGVVIAYILMTAIMLGPGFILHVYPLLKLYFSSLVVSSDTLMDSDMPASCVRTEPDALDEFLPEPTPETLEALAGALDPLDTDDKDEHLIASREFGMDDLISAEPDTLSLQEGVHVLPSHDKNSDDELDEFNFDPSTVVAARQQVASGTTINFVSSHFNQNSDESDEDSLALGLDFKGGPIQNSDSPVSPPIADGTYPIQQMTAVISEQGINELASCASESVAVTELDSTCSNQQPVDKDLETETVTSIVEGCINETASPASLSRQQSTHSDADISDYEIVSESEFS